MKTSKTKSLKNRIRRLRFDHGEMIRQDPLWGADTPFGHVDRPGKAAADRLPQSAAA